MYNRHLLLLVLCSCADPFAGIYQGKFEKVVMNPICDGQEDTTSTYELVISEPVNNNFNERNFYLSLVGWPKKEYPGNIKDNGQYYFDNQLNELPYFAFSNGIVNESNIEGIFYTVFLVYDGCWLLSEYKWEKV